MTFGAPKTVFPCKGRGMKDRDSQMAQLKDHIKVLTQAESCEDWPIILSAHSRCGVQVSASPLGVLGDLYDM